MSLLDKFGEHCMTLRSMSFIVPVRGGPFDSWGEAMVFCEEKDCSANNGKKIVCS